MFGKKEFVKLVGIASEKKKCENCYEDVRYQVVHGRNWFVVLFIPLIPMSGQYYLECPECSTRFPIDKKEARGYLDVGVKERKNHTRKS